MAKIDTGTLLLAAPFLNDDYFARASVLICKHDMEEGTFGFTLNKKLKTTLDEIVEDMAGYHLPIYFGGPVSVDTLHYVHQYPQYFDDAVAITKNIYWGGNFEIVKALIKNNSIDPSKIKFFLGYSGWSQGQLENELKEDSWIVSQADEYSCFNDNAKEAWSNGMQQLGGKYKIMANYPIDPKLN